MKLKFFVLTLMVAMLGLAPAAGAAERVSLATGGTAGTYFPVGGALAKAASKSGKLQMTAETSNAAVSNVNLLSTKDIEFALVQNDVTFWAYNGQNMFKDKPVKGLRSVMAVYPEDAHLVVTKDSGIKKLEDLKGKRVSVGAPGSGTEADVQALIQMVNMSYKDFKADRLDYGATANRFKDNQIDAGFLITGWPSAAIMDIATTKDITLVNFDKKFMEDLQKVHPYFVPNIIPKGTYRGVDTDTHCPAVMAMIATHDGISEQAVYDFLKGVFDNLGEVHAAHAKAKDITLDGALRGLTAPLHPGAVKFYKEKGMKVD